MYKIVNNLSEVQSIIRHRWNGQSYNLDLALEDHLKNRDSIDIDELNRTPNFYRVTKIPFYWVTETGIEIAISVEKVHEVLYQNPDDEDDIEFEIYYAVQVD